MGDILTKVLDIQHIKDLYLNLVNQDTLRPSILAFY